MADENATPPLTDDELAKMRRREEAASPGPWERMDFVRLLEEVECRRRDDGRAVERKANPLRRLKRLIWKVQVEPEAIIGLVIVGAAVLLLLVLGGALWYEVTHPCVKRGPPQSCLSMQCLGYDSAGQCTSWMTLPFDCTACLERR